jgi:hypothetical protein
MRLLVLSLIGLLSLASCTSLPSPSGRKLVSAIEEHAFSHKRALVLGPGVTMEAARRASSDMGAMVMFCPAMGERSSAAGDSNLKASAPVSFVRDVAAQLKAMARSGDAWELMVAERARGAFLSALSSLGRADLRSFKGRVVLPDTLRQDQDMDRELRRVFADALVVSYLSLTGK